jgi:hypothetical protein
MRGQNLAARLALAAVLVSGAVALAASIGTRLGLWSYKVGVPLIYPAAVIGIVGLLSGVIWAIAALVRNSSEGARYGVIGLLGGIAVAGIPLNYERLELTAPPIHDISTDVGNAPTFKALLPIRKDAQNGPAYDGADKVKFLGRTTTVAALQKKYYGEVIPFAQFIKPAKLFYRALAIANDDGWHVVDVDEKEGRIEAWDTTFWFGFVDDIVIRVRPAGKLGARLDIRSKSRVGKSDLGSNASRLRSFLKRLKSMG